MNTFKIKFLVSALIGNETNPNDEDTLLTKCISLAYNDMRQGTRHSGSISALIKADKIRKKTEVKDLLRGKDYKFDRNLIDVVSDIIYKSPEIHDEQNRNKYVTIFGLAQKLVNMTFKYLYILSDFFDLTITKCDCPLDSKILEKIDIDWKRYCLPILTSEECKKCQEEINIKKCRWTQLTLEEYEICQERIEKILSHKLDELAIDDELKEELRALGNLSYDIICWTE